MLTVNCQSSIKIKDDITIYFDPLKVEANQDANIILITHTHWDHFSKEDILKIKKKNTKIIGPRDIKEQALLMGFLEKDIIITRPYQQILQDNITIKTVPAYNKDKNFHPKENNWLGYVVTINGITYYIMGDTDALEENEKIDCDVLCIPIGGTYTMNAKEAAEFANKLNPKTVIPIHYGLVVGSKEDVEILKKYLNSNIEIVEKITL